MDRLWSQFSANRTSSDPAPFWRSQKPATLPIKKPPLGAKSPLGPPVGRTILAAGKVGGRSCSSAFGEVRGCRTDIETTLPLNDSEGVLRDFATAKVQ